MAGMVTESIHRRLPIYIQVAEAIRRGILSGDFAPNAKLPSEHQLVGIYGVARATVRRALERLQQEGLVCPRRAVGSFVAEPRVEQDLDRLFGFSEFMVHRGMKPGSKLLTSEIVPVSSVHSPLLSRLNLQLGEKVIFLRRIRLGSGQPLLVANTYLPERFFPGFLEQDLARHSVYEIMESTYALKPDRAVQTFEAIALAEEEACLLGVPAGAPALLVERMGFARDVPVEYAIDYYRGDRTKFRAYLGSGSGERELRLHLG
jgi:GntR family transcriptional regulator